MAKRIFLSDIDLALNQIIAARLENLTTALRPSATVAMNGRIIYNTTTDTFQMVVAGVWVDVIVSTDTRLTDSRTPVAHEIINATAIGSLHTVSGATAGHVFRATGATTARLMKLDHSDLDSIGSNAHSVIDSHLGDDTKHRLILDTNDTGSTTELYSSAKIRALINTINSSISGALVFQGGYDAGTNTPMLDATPITGILKGWTYVVTNVLLNGVAQPFFSEEVAIGDMIIAKQDSPTSAAHWTVVNKNIPDILTATETLAGTAEIATTAEVTAGTLDDKIVTPLKLKETLSVDGGLASALKLVHKYSYAIPALASVPVTHGLNTVDVIVSVKRTLTPFDVVDCEVVITSAAVVTLNFSVAPGASEYTVTIIG